MQDLHSKLDSYGVRYEGAQDQYVAPDIYMGLSDLQAAGGTIAQVRFIGEGRCFDLSYVHGVLPDGTRVSVTHLPADFVLVPRRHLKKRLIEWAKEEGVFAKGIGLLTEANWSLLD